MYILVNGAFGVGKTTVARELRRLLPGSVIFDPEWIGYVLRRMPGYARSDYQNLAWWRRLSVIGARLLGLVFPAVVVPMAFSEPRYLDEVRSGLASRQRRVLHFCLTAPITVIEERLAARGELRHGRSWAWVHRRAAECCHAHEGPEFAIQVPTAHLAPEAVAAELARLIRAAP